jgi:hypothetical protein
VQHAPTPVELRLSDVELPTAQLPLDLLCEYRKLLVGFSDRSDRHQWRYKEARTKQFRKFPHICVFAYPSTLCVVGFEDEGIRSAPAHTQAIL